MQHEPFASTTIHTSQPLFHCPDAPPPTPTPNAGRGEHSVLAATCPSSTYAGQTSRVLLLQFSVPDPNPRITPTSSPGPQARCQDSPQNNSQEMMRFYRRFLSIRNIPVPIIAAINGLVGCLNRESRRLSKQPHPLSPSQPRNRRWAVSGRSLRHARGCRRRQDGLDLRLARAAPRHGGHTLYRENPGLPARLVLPHDRRGTRLLQPPSSPIFFWPVC